MPPAETSTLGQFAPDLLSTRYAEEMWALFEAGELKPDTQLTGVFVSNDAAADLGGLRERHGSSKPSSLGLVNP